MPKYFNTTDGPVTIDAYGRIVGGGEWFEHKETPAIRDAIDRGEVVIVDSPTEEIEESKDDSKTAGNKGA
jgi:hypothetical protein